MQWSFDPRPKRAPGPPAEATFAAINLKLVAAVTTGNELVVRILPRVAGKPVYIPFRSATATDGSPYWRAIGAPVSKTVASGSTLGTANSVAFKLWLVAFDDGGVVRLGIVNCLSRSYGTSPTLNTVSISTLAAHGLRSSTSGSGSSAQVIYTDSAAVSNKPFRVLGFLEWSSGLATAGTWSSAPTTVQIYGPDIALPGQVVQRQTSFAEAGSSTTSTSYNDITNTSLAITPTMTSNLIDVHYEYVAQQGVVSSANPIYSQQLLRGSTVLNFTSNNILRQEITSSAGGIGFRCGAALRYMDYPQATSATTYKLQHRVDNTSSTSSVNVISIVLTEIMA